MALSPDGFYDSVIQALTANSATTSNAQMAQLIGQQNFLAQQNAMNPYHAANMYGAINSLGVGAYVGETPKPTVQRLRVVCGVCGSTDDERHKAACEYWKDRCECHDGKASKVHRFVELLRMEIDAWHGNVLERCPA